MKSPNAIALSLAFLFSVGLALIFIGAGAGKLAALFCGIAIVGFATRLCR